MGIGENVGCNMGENTGARGSKAIVVEPPPVEGWVITKDFNSGILGNAVGGGDGFRAATLTIYDTPPGSGAPDSQCAKCQIEQDDSGTGSWGGRIDFDPVLTKGDSLYHQFYMYIPTGFQIASGNGSLKWVRYYADHANDTNAGALDIQLRDDGPTDNEFRMIRELEFIWVYFGTRGVLTKDTWHKVNIEQYIDDTARDYGGGAYIKVWMDNNLQVDSGAIVTIPNATDKVINMSFMNYYNSGSPIDQHLWTDNHTLYNAKPSWWDSTLE